MSIRPVLFHLEILITGYFFWLGLYVLVRAFRYPPRTQHQPQAWHERLELQGALTVILVSIYMLGTAMELVSDTPDEYIAWLRGTWWSLPPAVALWFRIFLLAPEPQTPSAKPAAWKHLLSFLVLLMGLSFGIVNQFTDFFFAYDQISVDTFSRFGSYYLPRKFPAYNLHAIYFLSVTYSIGARVLYLWWKTPSAHPQKQSIRYILLGTMLILGGSSFTTFNYLFFEYRFPQQIGDLVSAVGLSIVARHLIDYDAIFHGRVLLSDYRRTLLIASINSLGMLTFFHLLHWLSGDPLSYISVPTIVSTAVFITTTAPLFRTLANRLTLPSWEATLLDQIDSVGANIITAEDSSNALTQAQSELQTITTQAQVAQAQEQIQEEINRLFRHNTLFKDDALVESPLFDLNALNQAVTDFAQTHNLSLQQIPTSDKGQLLRAFLQEQVNQLNPPKTAEQTAETEQHQIEHLILYRGYIDKRTRKEIVDEIEDTIGLRLLNNSRAYTQHLNRARQRLATQIWRQEQQTNRNNTTHKGSQKMIEET